MTRQTIEATFFLAALGLAAALLAWLVKPFFHALILALVFAVLVKPLYRRIYRWLGKRPSLAALATVIILCLIIVGIIALIGTQVAQETINLYSAYLDPESSSPVIEQLTNQLQALAERVNPFITVDLESLRTQALTWLIDRVSNFFSGFVIVAINLFLMLLSIFYLLRDGANLRRSLISIIPLPAGETEAIIERLETTVTSVIRGSLTVAVIQGTLTGVGFALFGLPQPVLGGSVAAVAALIPGIGTALVLAPGVLYLFWTGAMGNALGLLIWGVLAVGLIDNLLGPILVGRSVALHPFLILLSVLGGLAFFGLTGFVLGPLILSLFFALLTLYAHHDTNHV